MVFNRRKMEDERRRAARSRKPPRGARVIRRSPRMPSG